MCRFFSFFFFANQSVLKASIHYCTNHCPPREQYPLHTHTHAKISTIANTSDQGSLNCKDTGNKGKTKKTKNRDLQKWRLNPKDDRLPKKNETNPKLADKRKQTKIRRVEQVPSAMFFKYNTQLHPFYRIIVDTNFINFSIKTKLDVFSGNDGLFVGKMYTVTPTVSIAELKKVRLEISISFAHSKRRAFYSPDLHNNKGHTQMTAYASV